MASRQRPDRAANRRGADDRPDRADARGADRVGHRPVDGPGRVRGGSRARPRRRPGPRLSGRPGVPRRAPRRLSRREPRGTRDLVGTEWRADLPNGHPQLDHAGSRSPGGPPDRPRRSRLHRGRASRDQPTGRVRRRHRGVSSVARCRCREHPADEGRTCRPGDRGHRTSPCGVAALLRRPAEGSPARCGRSRSTRSATRPSRTTTRRPPTPHGPGIYYVNSVDLPEPQVLAARHDDVPRGAPGHHFQISLEIENPHLNTFRRFGARAVGGAYIEGWGLYSERLADEMGLYRNEGERFGMLDAQAWRAARLVVDTGLHALRWPRQQSIDFLRGAGLSETDAVIETDRYIAWPGQALTYKIGQREIERLRAEMARPRRRGVRPPGVPRPAPRPRLAAPGDPRPRAPELARDSGLTFRATTGASVRPGGPGRRPAVLAAVLIRDGRIRRSDAHESCALTVPREARGDDFSADHEPGHARAHEPRSRQMPMPTEPPRAQAAAREQSAMYQRALRDDARRDRLELPRLGRGHGLHRPRQGRPDLGHGRQRVHRPAHGLRPGDPGPRATPGSTTTSTSACARASASRSRARTRSRRWSSSRSSPAGSTRRG